MLSFLHKYAKNYNHSQNGEEGVVLECWRRLLGIERLISAEIARQDGTVPLWVVEGGRAVEIGGNDGLYCSNTALLAEHGWETLFVEADYSLYQKCAQNWAGRRHVRSQCSRVDGKNINAFVDHFCDVLSLDTDGSDYQIFKGLNAKPKIIIIEIDSSYPPDVIAFNSDGAGTYRNTVELGISKGYFLLCHTGNLVFVANEYRELFPEIEGDGLSNAELYFKRDWLSADQCPECGQDVTDVADHLAVDCWTV